MMLKIFLLTVACFISADARRLDRFFWDDDSRDTEKRSYSKQVCEDVTAEKWVSTSTFVKNGQPSHLFPQNILKVRCKIDKKQANGVRDSSIICKTKQKQIDVVEFNDQGVAIAVHQPKVPTDCVAYKI